MKTLNLLILASVLHFTPVIGQSTHHKFRCRVNFYEFELPENFKYDHFHYMEGDYHTYYRNDSTNFTLHCGGSVQLPHLEESKFTVFQSNQNERSGIQTNNQKYWRELNLGNEINMYYFNTGLEDKRVFDKIIKDLLAQLESSK